MRVVRHLGDLPPPAAQRVIAYSTFDGMHLGHQHLLAVLGDLPSPAADRWAVVDETDTALPRLSSRRRLWSALRAAGAAGAVHLRRTAGDVEALLPALGAETVLIAAAEETALAAAWRRLAGVEEVKYPGQMVSCARLRVAIRQADLAAARAMLGRDYAVEGRVVHGFHRGASIGVPTANLRVRDLQLPPDGVYAVRTSSVAGELFGVANLGRNPTFGNDERSLETHLFDFSGDLYGRRLEVAFVERVRDERKFDGVDALVAQIRRDIEAARAVERRQ